LKDFVTGITNEYELDCKYIDIGGGIAPRIIFTNDKESEYFFTRISSIFRKYFSSEVRLIIEPGRYLVSDAVIVLARIKTIKYMGGKTWAVLDIGTNYLIPAPGCNYKVIPCVESETFSKKTTNVMFVDGICSPAGHIGESNMDVKEGQVVAVLNCGAYTSVMKEEFVFCTPRHVYIESGKVVKVVKKKTFAEFAKFHGW
jgi:diaminopimelate decarboxylase